MADIPVIPFFTQTERIAEQIVVGLFVESPAILVHPGPGEEFSTKAGGFAYISAPQAKRLADIVKKLAQ